MVYVWSIRSRWVNVRRTINNNILDGVNRSEKDELERKRGTHEDGGCEKLNYIVVGTVASICPKP